MTARRPPDRARRRREAVPVARRSPDSTRSLPATRSHFARRQPKPPRSRPGSCPPTTPTRVARTHDSSPSRSATSSTPAAGRSTSPATPTCSTRCTTFRRSTSPCSRSGVGGRRSATATSIRDGRRRHALDRAEVRRPDPLGHVHADHPEARHTALDREPVRSLYRGARRARPRRPAGRAASRRDDDDGRRAVS